MKAEAWVFGGCAIFVVLLSPTYWFITGELTGTLALLMTALLLTMLTAYLCVQARRIGPRWEDRADAEVDEAAGEFGFFSPFSWWPLWVGISAATASYSIAVGAWWLFIIAGVALLLTVLGLLFEYYRGEFKH